MELNQVKKMAARVMKCGVTKVKIMDREKCLQTMTKDDIRALIKQKVIRKKIVQGPSKARARKIKKQKKKGLRKGTGSRKGTRVKRKKLWMKTVRAQRSKLKWIKPKLSQGNYRKLYKMINGGYFRNKAHLMTYIKDKKMLKG